MQEKSESLSKALHLQYNRVNTLLNMIAVPYLGVYSSNYTFMMPINLLHKKHISKSSFVLFPDKLQKHLSELSQIDLDHFIITLDGNFLNLKNNKTDLIRLNFVPHPYIFYDITKLNKDHVTYIISCLYSDDPFHSIYLKETYEHDGLRLNPEKFLSDQNKKEIILHRSNDNFPALSPNNCAFLVNKNKSFYKFYNLTAITYMGKIVKCAIIEYNIFNQNPILALSPVYESFNSIKLENWEGINVFMTNLYSAKENFKNIILTVLTHISKIFNRDKIKDEFDSLDFIKNIFSVFFIRRTDELHDGNELIFQFNNGVDEIRNICNFNYDSLCYFIWYNLGHFRISAFGEKVINSSEPGYLIELIRKYLNYLFKEIDLLFFTIRGFFRDILENQIDSFKEVDKSNSRQLIDENILELQYLENKNDYLALFYKTFIKNEIVKQFHLDLLSFVEFSDISHSSKENLHNKNLQILREIIEDIFSENFSEMKAKLDSLDEVYKYMIFYLVWERKGRIIGIHNDFGKMSFLRSNEISRNYHCNQEEQVEILLEIISLIEAFDAL